MSEIVVGREAADQQRVHSHFSPRRFHSSAFLTDALRQKTNA